jgi:asparagine synthase (glutamine-hydrolysing)
VLLAAYARWGVGCLAKLRGMFAFAIWDRRENCLFAARDRMGVKPLFYHHCTERFAFASRPRALWQLIPDLRRDIDQQALRFYLECGYVPAPLSIYETIRKLPPAHYLLFDRRGIAIERYWDFRQISPSPTLGRKPEQELLDELDQIASKSVQARMISDVPFGAFLSGGIDSSLVVALMRKFTAVPVKTFTIGFVEKEFDESRHSEAVAKHLCTHHHCELLQVDDLLSLLPTFQQHFDEPFFDSSAFPTMAVSRLARRHVTVSLTGDGGDELFGGYHYYKIAQYLEAVFAIPHAARRVIASLIGLIPTHKISLLAGALSQAQPIDAFGFARSISKDFSQIFSADLLAKTHGVRQLLYAALSQFPAKLKLADQGMRIDALLTLPDDYLQKIDVASMAFSLESREPLLDHELVEWSMKLPVKWKLRAGTNKYLLRELSYRYVPRDLLNRPKQGFAVPIDRWLRGPLKDWAEARINDTSLFHYIPVEQAKAKTLFSLHISRRRNVHPLLWAILMLLDFIDAQRRAFRHA